MRKLFVLICLLSCCFCVSARQVNVRNPFIWSDVPDPDVIRVGDYYYMVSTTMHLFPGGPVMRSADLVHWETVSYLFDEIKDTPRYDMSQGTIYGRGQWATSLRYHDGTFWALFVANDDPHKSMVFKTDDPAKGWTLHSRLPAYHDSSLFFDDDGRVYVFSGSGDIRLVELSADLRSEKQGGVNKVLELRGKPSGLHEGSRVVKHDGMYYLLCVSWPQTGRQEIAYRSRNIEGPYDSKVILKSEFGGFPYAGQGTIVDGKHGEWYGVMFQDRGGVGRVLTIEPCSWIDGWPLLGTLGDGRIPATLSLESDCLCADGHDYAVIEKDYQWNHNYIKEDIKVLRPDVKTRRGDVSDVMKSVTYNPNGKPYYVGDMRRAKEIRLSSSVKANSIFDARNTLTWRTWGPYCSDTICIDLRHMRNGDRTGLAMLNGDTGMMMVEKKKSGFRLVMCEENVRLSNDKKEITKVDKKEYESVEIRKGQESRLYLRIDGDFTPGKDIATFYYSLDGERFKKIGCDYKMRFDFMRLFMGSRYAAFYYSTAQTGGYVDVTL